MPEETEEPTLEPEETAGEGEPGGEPEPPVELTPQERASWEGRVRAEQDKNRTTNDQLAQFGLRRDPETGQVVPILTQTGQYPTTAPQVPAPSAEPEFDWDAYSRDPQAVIDARVQQGIQQALAQYDAANSPLIGRSLEMGLERKYPDWTEIGSEVKQTLTNWGFQDLAHAERQAEALLKVGRRVNYVEDAIFRVRGMRNQPIIDMARKNAPGEVERQGRIADGATVGGSPSGVVDNLTADLTSEDRAELIRAGMSPQQWAEMGQPVVIDILGTKKGKK